MAQEPSSGRPQQEQEQFTPETAQAAEAVEQEPRLSASAQQAEAPEQRAGNDQPTQEEQSEAKSPGWTDHGGMVEQQESALDYNEWVNKPYAEHNAGLQNAQENPVAEPPAATQESSEAEQEHAERLQQARDMMAAINERLEQSQELQQEKVIGD
jgi:hypothetical protein